VGDRGGGAELQVERAVGGVEVGGGDEVSVVRDGEDGAAGGLLAVVERVEAEVVLQERCEGECVALYEVDEGDGERGGVGNPLAQRGVRADVDVEGDHRLTVLGFNWD
jgi:hypothetical protein